MVRVRGMLLDKKEGVTHTKVILFIPEDADCPDQLHSLVESIRPFVVVEIVRSVGYLKGQFLPQAGQLGLIVPIVIVLSPTKGDLKGLLKVEELFENARLILLLRDTDEETVALGHRLRPRFISYLGNGFSDIVAVVRKMAGDNRETDYT